MPHSIPELIALELVPRSLDGLLEESRSALASHSAIQAINIPEIRSVAIKSQPASLHLLRHGLRVIPHLRTIDRTLPVLVDLVGEMVDAGLQEVLLLSGDPPADPDFVSSGVGPVDAIASLRSQFPTLKVYAALDPYRQALGAEMDYCKRKLDAGAHGFFTQPYFSVSLLEATLEFLPGVEIWVGVSPVTTDGSLNYWKTVNRVPFAPDFSLDLQWNAQRGRELLACAAAHGQRAYLMPITISASRYLPALFPA